MATKIPGAGTKQPEQEVQAAPVPADIANLPNAIDVDIETLTGPTLTRQGWLCPEPKKAKA